MKTEDVSSIAVVEDFQDGTLLGVVSDRDLALKVIAEGRDARTTRAGDVMSRGLVLMKFGKDAAGPLPSGARMELRGVIIGDRRNGIGLFSQSELARLTSRSTDDGPRS